MRARITQAVDLAGGEGVVTTAATADEIQATIEAWLDEFLSA